MILSLRDLLHDTIEDVRPAALLASPASENVGRAHPYCSGSVQKSGRLLTREEVKPLFVAYRFGLPGEE